MQPVRCGPTGPDLGRRLSEACRHEPRNVRRSCAARCTPHRATHRVHLLPGVHRWRVRPHRDPRSHDLRDAKRPTPSAETAPSTSSGTQPKSTTTTSKIIVTITEPETAASIMTTTTHDHDHLYRGSRGEPRLLIMGDCQVRGHVCEYGRMCVVSTCCSVVQST